MTTDNEYHTILAVVKGALDTFDPGEEVEAEDIVEALIDKLGIMSRQEWRRKEQILMDECKKLEEKEDLARQTLRSIGFLASAYGEMS